MKPVQVVHSAVAFLFLVCRANAGVTGGLKTSNATSEESNRPKSDDISKLFEQLQPLAAPSDNVASVSTLTSSNDINGPSSFVSNTVTSTSGNPSQALPVSRGPAAGSRFGLPGAGVPFGGSSLSPLTGGVGVPFGGFPGSPLGGGVPFAGFAPGVGTGAGVGFDVGVGGGIIEKAVVCVGGGILILLALAAAQKAAVAGGLLKDWDNWDVGSGLSASGAGSVSVAGAGGSSSAAASAAASASLSKNVDEAINRRF